MDDFMFNFYTYLRWYNPILRHFLIFTRGRGNPNYTFWKSENNVLATSTIFWSNIMTFKSHQRSNLGQIVELGTHRSIKSYQRSNLGETCQNESNRADWSQKLFLTPCCKWKNWGPIVFRDSIKIVLKEWNSRILWLIIHDSLHMSHCSYDVMTSLTFIRVQYAINCIRFD